MTVPQPRSGPGKRPDAGVFQPGIGSFRLHLAAEGKAARTCGPAPGRCIPASGQAPASGRVRISVRITGARNRFTRRAAW